MKNWKERLADMFIDVYCCTRVWEAWQYNTMTEDDFVEYRDCESMDELTEWVEQERILAQIELLEDQLQSTSGDIPREAVEKELKKLKTVTTK